jgi:hypothetical protein
MDLEPYDETTARRVARVLGESCAAAKALRDLERRRGEGEQVSLYIQKQRGATAVVVAPTV